MENDLLKLELCKLNTFIRHHFQLYLGWYTFFLTVNFGAIGWFTSVMLTGALKVSLPVVFIALFFVAQLIFSYIASREVRRYLVETVQRIGEILAQLSDASPDSRSFPKTAIPLPRLSEDHRPHRLHARFLHADLDRPHRGRHPPGAALM